MPELLQKIVKRPIIAAEANSKVPTNVRQRYLNLFCDECLNIYPEDQDAFERVWMDELVENANPVPTEFDGISFC